MRTPTDEQKAVIDDTSRIRVVRAAPGSGKTWLVAEIIRTELADPSRVRAGIAALSFTRVGGEEIRQAVGNDLTHPHFVGTLDSFLYRYVVRPFAKQILGFNRAPRLIPADAMPAHWKKGPGGTSFSCQSVVDKKKSYNLFEVYYVGEDANGPLMSCPQPYRGLEPVAAADRDNVLKAKREFSHNLGWLTHADAALIASRVLAHPSHGATVRTLLANRFPLLIVDEFQDTGYFLGKCVRSLLETPQTRGVLVGDPDQAIYEFNGARPDLFDGCDSLAGSKKLSLTQSLRCPTTIAEAASHLKESVGTFVGVTGRAGRSILIPYDNMADIPTVVASLTEKLGAVRVITRSNGTIAQLVSGKAEEIKSLNSPALTHLAQGVQKFRQGNPTRALACARACLDRAVFDREGLSDDDLLENTIDPKIWKALAVTCLLKAQGLNHDLVMQAWQVEAGKMLDTCIATAALPAAIGFQAGQLKPNNFSGKTRTDRKADTPFKAFAPVKAQAATTSFVVETIHAVKGQTHDTTILVCPETKAANCPSNAWWPSGTDEKEERRIAYVAMTRSKGSLILCVPKACHGRLLFTRKTFCDSFVVLKPHEVLAADLS